MHYNFKKIKDSDQEGDKVQLLREPTNIYDSFAIKVSSGEDRLGCLAAYENIVLANMVDAGVGLRAYVSQKDLKRPAQEWIAVEIFAELVIPTQKLMDSMLADNRADNAPDIYRLGEV